MSLEKPLEEITEDDLKALTIPEGKIIDYKSLLYSNSDDHKKKFLADVSSFANAAGGHLIFGITEENGLPTEVVGLGGINPDAEILRMENMLRDNIEPRIPGVSMWAVPLENTNVVIVIRIPHSWNQPHAVNYGSHWRFYSRNSAGKYPLDVGELRTAFALSETTTERIRSFRAERLGKIVAGEAPIAVGDNAKIVLHIIPFGAFDPSANFDPSSLEEEVRWSLWPIYGRPHKQRYNLDGLLSYSVAAPLHHSYVQLFRSGIIESVETSMLMRASRATNSEKDSLPFIPSAAFEGEILRVLPMYLRVQKILGVTPPLFIMLSLIGVSGFVMGTGRRLDPFGDYMHPIDRDTLILPEVIVENVETGVDAPATVMRPIFDSVWNATGWPRSMSYNDKGEWGKGSNS
jgi:hypothetical protein